MKYLSLAIVVFVSSCSLPYEAPVGWEYKGFSHPETFTSMAQITAWTSAWIFYHTETSWQSPETTYETLKGDCRSFTALAMYFAHEIGIDTTFVLIDVGEDIPHAELRINATGELIDAQIPDGEPTLSGPIVAEYSYRDAMWISVNY